MKKLLILVAITLLAACAPKTLAHKSDKEVTFTKFEGNNIEGIDVGGAWNVTINYGQNPKAVITITEKYKDYFNFKMKGNNLIVEQIKDFKNGNMECIFKIDLTCTELGYINISGAARTQINDNFSTSKLYVDASGAAKINGNAIINCSQAEIDCSGAAVINNINIKAEKNINFELSGAAKFDAEINTICTKMNVSGAAKVNINGKTEKFNIEASGASNVNSLILEANDVNVEASGASIVSVLAKDKLTIERSGAAKVGYKGNPYTNFKIDGINKIN